MVRRTVAILGIFGLVGWSAVPAHAATGGLLPLFEEVISALPKWVAPFDHAPFEVPLPSILPAVGRITSVFGGRERPRGGATTDHAGVDIANARYSSIRAVQEGVVATVGWHGGYGLTIEIDHGYGWRTRYAHLGRCFVVAGQIVHAGSLIGLMGSSGVATGPHLHFELRYAGMALDPMPFLLRLAARPRALLGLF